LLVFGFEQPGNTIMQALPHACHAISAKVVKHRDRNSIANRISNCAGWKQKSPTSSRSGFFFMGA